ncbi:hypothetical protein [Pseudomonas sp. RC3H12]|uniref:hypothetical protein n=1 Tax=Pseudomonas sp. RC3H12 TaxID=2834406 RepID=UPI001BDE4B60|nr:hypothetical protein [Pseudomonas sp. RC3H12]QWA30533.1 hypothetical protein KHO27_06565 [Pseudomonas sp. RC3H12]
MSTAMEIRSLIIELIGSGVSDAALRVSLKQRSTWLAADRIDEALQDLQHTGVITGAGGMWLPGHAELMECYNPEIVEQLLNPGEFVEVDVDQLIAELEAMLVKARSK